MAFISNKNIGFAHAFVWIHKIDFNRLIHGFSFQKQFVKSKKQKNVFTAKYTPCIRGKVFQLKQLVLLAPSSQRT